MADPQVAAAGGLAPPSAPQAAAPAPVPTSAAAPVQVPFWESAGRSFGLGATRASATLPFLGGGLAAQTGDALDAAHRGLDWLARSGMPGASTLGNASDALEHGARWAQDKSDQLFDVSQQVRAAGDDEYGPRGNERFNRWGQIAGQLPVGLGTFPLQTAERAQDLSDQGVPADAAQRAVLADTAFNTATAALPAAARGGWLTRAATGGVIGTGTSVAGRQAERLALGDDAPADVSSQPVFDTEDVIGGVLGGLVGGCYGVRNEALLESSRQGPLKRLDKVSAAPDRPATGLLHDPKAIEINDEEPEHLEAVPLEQGEASIHSPGDASVDDFDWDSGMEVNDEEPEHAEATLPTPSDDGPTGWTLGADDGRFDWDSRAEAGESSTEGASAAKSSGWDDGRLGRKYSGAPAPPGHLGAMERAVFDNAVSAERHVPGVARGRASPGPINGQDALDTSLRVGANSSRRVGVDYANGQFVVFHEHSPGVFHGHVRPWNGLGQDMQALLRRAGMADKHGNITYGSGS